MLTHALGCCPSVFAVQNQPSLARRLPASAGMDARFYAGVFLAALSRAVSITASNLANASTNNCTPSTSS